MHEPHWRDYQATAIRYRTIRRHNPWDWVVALTITGAIWLATAAVHWAGCKAERDYYQRVTGRPATVWQAWLYDLRAEADKRGPAARWRGESNGLD